MHGENKALYWTTGNWNYTIKPWHSLVQNKYSHDGIYPDPTNLQDIEDMTVPIDKQQLQLFLGMIT